MWTIQTSPLSARPSLKQRLKIWWSDGFTGATVELGLPDGSVALLKSCVNINLLHQLSPMLKLDEGRHSYILDLQDAVSAFFLQVDDDVRRVISLKDPSNLTIKDQVFISACLLSAVSFTFDGKRYEVPPHSQLRETDLTRDKEI